MKTVVLSTAALLLAGSAAAQTPTPSPAPTQTPPPASQPAPGSSMTRDLNSGPPAAATYLAPAPAPVQAAPIPTPPPARPTPVLPSSPPPSMPASPAVAPIPTTPSPRPRMTPITPEGGPRPVTPAPGVGTTVPDPRPAAPSATVTPAPAAVAPAPVAEPPPPPPSVPTVTVLDATARAALPFTTDLPRGFEIVTGRPGPGFRIYTIRRGERSFVMVYAGPNSQFPLYSGEQVEAGGRVSVVSTEDGERHAKEHLFRRTTAPLEVHVWTMTLEGADRALAEQIAQSIDAR